MRAVSVRSWLLLPRGTSWFPTSSAAVYSRRKAMSRTPAPSDGLVGELSAVHDVVPLASRAWTCRMNSMLSESTQPSSIKVAITAKPTGSAPTRNVRMTRVYLPLLGTAKKPADERGPVSLHIDTLFKWAAGITLSDFSLPDRCIEIAITPLTTDRTGTILLWASGLARHTAILTGVTIFAGLAGSFRATLLHLPIVICHRRGN
jgi:hypothetical protein